LCGHRSSASGAIRIGDGTFINVDAVMLDVMPITIGATCQIGTRVQLLTAAIPSIRSLDASAGNTDSR
jgi:acetyltransferase-like isoleucine patch superfamily enzyme